MACCQELQTECLKVVNIGYLKTFIGTYLQNSSGGTVVVGGSHSGDTSYCPTYLELTNGSILPKRQSGSTSPKDDTDGIIVSTVCYGTSANYANNQLVNQKDLSLEFTRIGFDEGGSSVTGITITTSDGTNRIGACGGETKDILPTYKYTRTTMERTGDSGCSAVTSSSTIVNGNANDLAYTKTLTASTITKNATGATYTITRNGTPTTAQTEFPSRTDTVKASVAFRNTTYNSNELKITQDALTGQYVPSGDNKTYTNVELKSDKTSFGCSGGSFSASATGYYYTTSYWRDSCGVNYTSITAGTEYTENITTGITTIPEIYTCSISGDTSIPPIGGSSVTKSYVGSKSGAKNQLSGSFGPIASGESNSVVMKVEYHGFTDSITFTQNC